MQILSVVCISMDMQHMMNFMMRKSKRRNEGNYENCILRNETI